MSNFKDFSDASTALRSEYEKLEKLFIESIGRLNAGKNEAVRQHQLLQQVKPEFDRDNPVTIALLGSTGHGKSTLANAILGYEVLPTSFSKVCTAGITRVRFTDIDGFHATVTFLSEEAVFEEISQAKNLLQNEMSNPSEVEPKARPGDLLEEATKTRLESILGTEMFEKFLETYGSTEVSLPQLITDALRRKTDILQSETPSELKRKLTNYLVVPKKNSEGSLDGAYWPIVQDVLIEGRFKEIAHGAQLVDLPGLNDPNPAREKVTTNYLKDAKFVFVVFRFSRGITEDIHKALKPRNLLKKLLLEGSSNSITFVATHCDSLQIDADSEEALQNQELGIEELTKKIIDEHRIVEYPLQLSELGRELIPGDSQSEEVNNLRNLFAQSAIYMTAAQNHLNISRKKRGEKVLVEMRFSNEELTGIPDLRNHISTLSLEAGPKMLVKRIQNKLIEPANRMISILTAESNMIDLSNQTIRSEFERLIEHIASSKIRTEEILHNYLAQQREYLQQTTKDFITSINVSPISANKIKTDFETYLFSINHWRTMKAVMQYGGKFYSSSRGAIDIKGQIIQPIFDSAFLPWIRFFEGPLAENVDQTKMFFIDTVNGYIQNAESNFPSGNSFVAEKDVLTQSLRQMLTSLEGKIDQVKESLNGRISATRVTLTDIISTSVDVQMNPLIRSAADESGTGMMSRIRETLNSAARGVIENSFSMTREKIAEEIEVAIFEIGVIFQEVHDLVSWEIENFSKQFEVDEFTPKPVIDEQIPILRARIEKVLNVIRSVRIYTDWDRITDFPNPDEGKQYMIVDGSNVCTRKILGSGVTSIDVLLSCRTALLKKFPEKTIITLVDSAFIYKLERASHKARFDDLVSQKILRQIPSRIEGGGDVYILTMADHYNAVVVSDDAFVKHVSRFPFIREAKRRLTFQPVDGPEWYFHWA